jgi:4-alpha-glucanotransferase
MRWERYWHEDHRFIPINEYPRESMTTVSTHDSEPVSMWWRDFPSEAKVYAESKGWLYEKKIQPNQLFEILRESHQSKSLFHINLLQEYLALFPNMVWPKLDDERINIPGKISKKNWSYRFRPSVEEICSSAPLREAVKNLIQ